MTENKNEFTVQQRDQFFIAYKNLDFPGFANVHFFIEQKESEFRFYLGQVDPKNEYKKNGAGSELIVRYDKYGNRKFQTNSAIYDQGQIKVGGITNTQQKFIRYCQGKDMKNKQVEKLPLFQIVVVPNHPDLIYDQKAQNSEIMILQNKQKWMSNFVIDAFANYLNHKALAKKEFFATKRKLMHIVQSNVYTNSSGSNNQLWENQLQEFLKFELMQTFSYPKLFYIYEKICFIINTGAHWFVVETIWNQDQVEDQGEDLAKDKVKKNQKQQQPQPQQQKNDGYYYFQVYDSLQKRDIKDYKPTLDNLKELLEKQLNLNIPYRERKNRSGEAEKQSDGYSCGDHTCYNLDKIFSKFFQQKPIFGKWQDVRSKLDELFQEIKQGEFLGGKKCE